MTRPDVIAWIAREWRRFWLPFRFDLDLARREVQDKHARCPRCLIRFSDWFVTRKGERYCYPCWDLAQECRSRAGMSDMDFEPFVEREETRVCYR